jgi:hypothetical protein
VWIRSDGKSPPSYRIMPAGKTADDSRELVWLDGAGPMSMLPDGSGLVFERGLTYRTNYNYGDLYRFDFATGAETRLTHGVRAADPAVSPDGAQVAFTINGGSRLRLAIMPLTDDDPVATVVWEGEDRFSQVFSPDWSPDGKQLIFSVWEQGGYRDLYLLDLATRATRRLMHDRAIDGEPAWSPDGKWIYFSSDRTGIYNLYAISPDGEALWQVTNVIGGAFSPDVSPDGEHIVYMGFDSEGFELYQIGVDESAWLVPEAYVSDRPEPTEIPDDEVWVSEPRDYRPLETLAPSAYRLQLVTDSFGSAVSLVTDGYDVVGWHGYTMGATVGLERGDVSFGASYAYSRLWPSFRVGVGRSIGQPGGLVVNGTNLRYTEESWGVTTAVSLPVLRGTRYSGDMVFSYDLTWLRNVQALPPINPNDPVTRLPETGLVAGMNARFQLSSLRRATFAIGPISGRSMAVALRYLHPDLGGDFQGLELTYRWSEFWQMPYAWSHVVSFRLTGGIEETDRRRDGAYALGGLGEQNIADAILNSTRASSATLRGYEPGALRGRQFHLVNLEYRFPLRTIERGWVTMPIYFRRVHAALLFDAGFASNEEFDWGLVRPSVGGALRLDAVFGWFEPGTFELGYSRGLGEGGLNETWFLLTGSL